MVVEIPCEYCPAHKDGSPQYIIADFKDQHNLKVHPDHFGQPEHDNGVQFYSEHAQQLKHSQQAKILRFLAANCIEYAGGNVFICKPLQGYNHTTHRMRKEGDHFTCTCQHYTKHRTPCAHIGALHEFLKRGKSHG